MLKQTIEDEISKQWVTSTISPIELRDLHTFAKAIVAATLEEMMELVHQKKVAYHKGALSDTFVNGQFWAAQEIWEEEKQLKDKILSEL